MQTQRFRVRAKLKQSEFGLAAPSDFDLEQLGVLPPEAVLIDPRHSLYCLDLELQRALFVRTPEAIDPTGHGFYYQAQYVECDEVVSMPLEVMLRVARAVPFEPVKLVLLHSTGRCGSTLLSKALGQVPGVESYSEPDVLTRLTHLRQAGASREPELLALIDSCVRLLCKSSSSSNVRRYVLKFRSQVMELADLLWQAFPQATTVFLYRNALSWLDSFLRALLRGVEFTREDNQWWEDELSRCHPLVVEYRRPEAPMSPACLWTLGWASSMERYLELQDRGLAGLPVRFEDLCRQPQQVFERVLEHLGLEPDVGAEVRAVLSADSQAGTLAARSEARGANATPLGYFIEAKQVLATRPRLGHADFRIAGTLSLRQE